MDHCHSHTSNTSALKRAFLLTVLFMFVEVIGGYLTNSMALLSDGLHMLTDAAALGLSLVAFILSKRPASLKRTFGFYRLEVLAAFANGVFLIILSGFIISQSWQRLKEPTEIKSLEAMGIVILGLVFNMLSAREILKADSTHLNVKGALFHVIGDLIGSVGALLALGLTYWFNWAKADAFVSMGISLLIIASAWKLISDTTNVMLEGAPHHIDVKKVQEKILSLPEVDEVHDLHIWCISSDLISLSAHVVSKKLSQAKDLQMLLSKIHELLKTEFGIDHSTIQIELEDMKSVERTH